MEAQWCIWNEIPIYFFSDKASIVGRIYYVTVHSTCSTDQRYVLYKSQTDSKFELMQTSITFWLKLKSVRAGFQAVDTISRTRSILQG